MREKRIRELLKLSVSKWITLLFMVMPVSCVNSQAIPPTQTTVETAAAVSTNTASASPTSTSTATTTPQPRLSPVTYGPEAENFPSGVNPLTGRAVLDESLLSLPAVLVSISNMPVTARPQAGPGFAPWVFELYIGEGATRFMNVFYGEYPRFVPNVGGGCDPRENISHPTRAWVGNRVWLDENVNGRQDDWELGVGGVCVSLHSIEHQEQFWQTTTDTNGYYSFELPVDEASKVLDGKY